MALIRIRSLSKLPGQTKFKKRPRPKKKPITDNMSDLCFKNFKQKKHI